MNLKPYPTAHSAACSGGRFPAVLASALFVFALWSVPAQATDNPDELSRANQALFTANHLETIKEPVALLYDFEKSGSLEDGFSDKVIATITDILPSGRKNMSFKFLTGKQKIRFDNIHETEGNPVFMLFLERDAREMQRMTGGNALYFRNRIRQGLASTNEIKPTTFTFDGKEYKGREIDVHPYAEAELKARFKRFSDKTYTFILSDEIPGGIYQVRSLVPAEAGTDSNEPLVEETMTFRAVGTRH